MSNDMGTDTILRSDDSQTRIISLILDNEARANALTASMLDQLVEHIDTAAPATRAIVITGRGHRFSGGIDLGDRSNLAGAAQSGATMQDRLDAVGQSIRSCPVPVVALVNGVCVGGSVELIATCDLRVALDTALFKVPATRIGIIYRPAGYDALLRRLDPTAVRRLVLLGMELSASEAVCNGLVDLVAPTLEAAMGQINRAVEGLAGPTFALQKAALDAALASRALDKEHMQSIQDLRDRSTDTN
jgi:enoyl-CoA hydratase